MLGGEIGEARRKGLGNKSIQLNALLVLFKALRAIALCQAFSSIFLAYDFPVTLFTFYTLVGSSCIFLILQQPWVNGRKAIQPNQWVQIGFYSLLLMFNFFFWNLGLKYYGPTRTVLGSDHADLVFRVIFTAFFISKAKTLHPDNVRGALLLVVGYLLLFWVEPATIPEPIVNPPTTYEAVPIAPSRAFQLGFIYIPETKVGGVCLFIAVCLNMFRNVISKKLSREVGGVKTLHALSVPIAAALIFPFAAFSYFTTTSTGSIFSSGVFFCIVGVVLFGIVAEFYLESIVINQLGIESVAPLSLAASFASVCIYEWTWGTNTISWMTFVCFFLILWGTKMIFQQHEKADLPVYATSGTRPFSIFSFAFLKMAMRQTWEGKESRRIFLYLLLNLTFMFVEMVYGFITNSLGLISDSAHMLFDCTALVIGLLASVISNWEPTPIFTFGYARVEVLSGFINGIFLIFIGFLVLIEALGRFYHPQEINTDKLLLVSFLGLCVNLVGLFAFHDLHDHGDEGDHGHSHGHSHDHKEEKKEKKKKHGHDHETSHEHDHGHKHKHKKKEEVNENRLGVFLHILADTLGSVGVIISSYFVQYWGWVSADPICSFFISILIFVSVIPFLYSSAGTLLQATPETIEKKMEKTLPKILKLEGVVGYANAHFWRNAKSQTIGTIHIQINGEVPEQKILAQVSNILKKKGGIKNLTVEIIRVT